MERLTKYWGNGEYGLINAFVTKNAEMCNALGRYEDEAERRENGCDFCRNQEEIDHVQFGYVIKNDCLVVEYGDSSIAAHDDDDLGINYCPFCGRKLV